MNQTGVRLSSARFTDGTGETGGIVGIEGQPVAVLDPVVTYGDGVAEDRVSQGK